MELEYKSSDRRSKSMHSITMRFSIVFLALFALAAAVPTTPKFHAADQDLLKKQQHVIYLLENIVGELPNDEYRQIGYTYEFEPYLEHYENPTVVKYYVGLVKTGHVQPKGTPYSYTVSQLRKEVALLTQIFLGAKDYDTFFKTACWARVHVNQEQFVTAFSQAVIQRHDLYGVILPPAYEVYPHYFFDTRIIQKVHDYLHQYHHEGHGSVYDVYVNYTSYLPFGENQIAYFTDDIGLAAYYSYVQLASYMLPQEYGHGKEGHKIGHGAHYYYIHQQLLARYNLERLAQGLEPIRELDYYYEHIETPFKPHLRYVNGVNFPGRDEHHYITPHHHNYELIKVVRLLERRILDAIHQGQVITPQGVFLSLYQPEGLNILGEIIEGTGHSINPRYYGAFQYVARELLGNAPEFNNIWEYTPSALELGQTAVRDPIFYQLYSKIIELFHYYQEALPAYQYNDIVVPGVQIEKVEVGDLVTYFSDYEVKLDNAAAQPVGKHYEQDSYPTVKAHMKRLDHKQYEYTIHVSSEKVVPGAVVRVYIGPKYNYDGQPIDINVHRHYFYEIDQFVHDLTEGHNVIVRNSHEFTGQSYDWPSVNQLKEHVEGAFHGQKPYYVHYPEHIYSFPARLTLPKGHQEGYPLQWFVIITAGVHHQPEYYGPIVEENWQTYQPHHYQVIDEHDYALFTKNPVDKVTGGYQTVEVVPHFEGQVITDGHWHWGYLYKRYPGSYYYPHWQQTHYAHYKTGGQNYPGYVHQYEKHGDYPEHHYEKHSVEHHYPEHQYEKQGAEHHYPEQQYQKQGGEYHYPEHHYEKQGAEHHYPEHQYVKQGEEHHYPEHHYEHQLPHVYHEVTEHPETGKRQQTVYKQGIYHHEVPAHHEVPVHHQENFHEATYTYPVNHQPTYGKGHDEYLHEYYEHKYIGDVIGGKLSLDGKPLGYPFDRQLAHSAFYAKNMYVTEVLVYHHEEYFPEY